MVPMYKEYAKTKGEKMINKNIENFLSKYPNVKKAMLYCFENDKHYGWFIHYMDNKKLGAKPKISKSLSFGTRTFYIYEFQGITGFHEVWQYLKKINGN